MTYRHFDCVFFNILDGNTAECLKNKKTFENISGYQRHCEDFILTPLKFISHLLYAKEISNGNMDVLWSETDKRAESILVDYGFAGMKLKKSD